MPTTQQNTSRKDKLQDIPQLGIDIAKSFHEQFAQNQNHHQVLYVQVLAVLVTVLVGFGYVYIRTKPQPPRSHVTALAAKPQGATFSSTSATRQKPISSQAGSIKKEVRLGEPPPLPSTQAKETESELNITVETLYAFLALASILLSFGVALISNMALGFRRDQMVAVNIRVLSRVMKQPAGALEKVNGTVVDFFPEGFSPVDKRILLFTWMPEFHKIFMVTLVAVKIALALSVFRHPQFGQALNDRGNAPFISTMFQTVCASLAADCLMTILYWLKWRKTALGAFKRLRSK
jgi:hypothetical protein